MKNYESGKFVNQGGYKSFQPTLLLTHLLG